MAKHLLKSTSIFSLMTLLSRIMGFLRDMIVAHLFGATGLTDAFFVAFKIPNFMRRLFAEGAFSQAFVPVLSEYKEKHSTAEMKEFINHMCGTLAAVLCVLTLLGMLGAPWVVRIFSPGFPVTGERYQLAVEMLRITFPYIFLISLAAFTAGVLNTHKHFAAPAFTPVLLNLSMIIFSLFLSHYYPQPIIALAFGVFFGGVLQLGFQLPFLKTRQLIPLLRWGWHDAGVKRVLTLMLPAIFGVSVLQIGSLIDTVFASFLPVGSITWLYNSERLMLFPVGGLAVALSTVVLPHLSKKFSEKSEAEYSHTLNWALKTVLIGGVPAAIGLGILAGPMLVTLFNYGQFNTNDVLMSRESLIAYALGVPFMMMLKVLASGFYARQNIKTPVKVAVIALCANVIFNFVFILPLKHAGLALASSLAALVNAGLLAGLLYKQKIYRPESGDLRFLLTLTLLNGLFAALLILMSPALLQWFSWSAWSRIWHLGLIILLASGVYWAGIRLSGLWRLMKGSTS